MPPKTSTLWKEPPSDFDGLLEITDRFLELALVVSDQTQIVIAFGIVVEAVDEETQNRLRLLVFLALIESGDLLFCLRRHLVASQRETPLEGVVGVPLGRLLIAELETPLDEVEQIFKLVPPCSML